MDDHLRVPRSCADVSAAECHTDRLRVVMREPFLAVLAEAARLYMQTEADVGYSLPADLWHFVEWCQDLAPQPPTA
jgi:hypothetical protein